MTQPLRENADLYRPLPSKLFHIRLLQIKNASQDDMDRGDWNVTVKCTLTTFPFDEHLPPYRCLSYVWGVPEPHDIIVNDTILPVSKNLIGFLRRLRYGSSDPDGYLWIDAICINQQDIDERTAQVREMDKIYAGASAVIAWLGWQWDRIGDASDSGRNEFASQFDGGPHTEVGTEDVIDMVSNLAEALRKWTGEDPSRPWSGELAGTGFDDMRMYTMLDIEPQSFMMWRGLWVFLDRVWFRRAWIVQEAVLAKRLICVVGLQIVPWDDILQVAIFLQASGWHSGILNLMQRGGLAVPAGYRTLLFENLRTVCQLQAQPDSFGDQVKLPTEVFATFPPTSVSEAEAYGVLARFITSGRPFGATDPRDKVFAPLLLTKFTLARFDIALPQPDYARLAQSVYNDITASIIERSADLYILSHVEIWSVERLGGLASWTPDYAVMYHSPLIDVMNLHFDALPGREKKVTANWRSGTIELEGYFFDTLADFPGPEGSSLEDMFLSRDYNPLIEFCLHKVKPQRGGQDRVEALWQTLTAGSPKVSAANFKRNIELKVAVSRYGGSQKAHIEPVADWSAWKVFDKIRETSVEARAAIPSTQELATFSERWRRMMTGQRADLVESKTVAASSDVFAVASGEVYGNRKIAVAGRGALVLAPSSAAKGDQIWFLSGAKVPFVLRPVKSAVKAFALIGEAYVHGYMRGEVLKDSPVFEAVILQ